MNDDAPVDDRFAGSPGIVEASFKGLCPRCGRSTLFEGWAKFSACCENCRLNFAEFNVGDGPAAFLTLILGTVVVALAIWVQLAFSPPFWVHILLWLPLTIIGVIGLLRIAKGALMALEYRQAVREGRVGRVNG